MGKKGKGNKLAKMSEEERARYLQMRADIEEEARRRKVQLISLYMKNKLKREDAFCRLNMAKINQEWRSILRSTKCEELRDEMLEVKKCFKEALERKERTVQRLLNYLDVGEDMYASLEQSHMETIDRLIGIHYQRMLYLKNAYEQERDVILAEYLTDFKDFKNMRAKGLEELECVMYQLQDINSKQLLEQHEKHLESLDDVKSAIQLRLEKITLSGEEKLERLWQDYQAVLSNYVKRTEVFYAEYMDLKEREEENTTTIKDNYRQIEHLSDQLANLKLMSLDVNEKTESKIDYLTKIKNELYIKLTLKKGEVDAEIKTDEARFKLMTVKSYKALKYFEGIAKKGEVLLQLTIVCRKYEMEREKILPFGGWVLPPLVKPMFMEETEKAENPEEELSYVPVNLKKSTHENWFYMEKFWQRVNNAAIDVVSLKQEKRKLEDENLRLKALLQEYLINLNISNGSNLHVNDYLEKRPSSMRVDRVTQISHEPSSLVPTKSQSAKSDSSGARRRFMGRVGFVATTSTSSTSNREPTNELSRRPFANITDANMTNAVRSERLVRGKPKLTKDKSFVNWAEVNRQNLMI